MRLARWRQHRHLDERVEQAGQMADRAAEQADDAHRRYALIKKTIIGPLDEKAGHNQFADMLRRSLTSEE